MVRGLALSAPLPTTSSEGLEVELITNHAYCDKASIRILKVISAESFLAGEHIHVLGGLCTPAPQGGKPLLDLALYISLSGCLSTSFTISFVIGYTGKCEQMFA